MLVFLVTLQVTELVEQLDAVGRDAPVIDEAGVGQAAVDVVGDCEDIETGEGGAGGDGGGRGVGNGRRMVWRTHGCVADAQR